jgi:hypothetical protein
VSGLLSIFALHYFLASISISVISISVYGAAPEAGPEAGVSKCEVNLCTEEQALEISLQSPVPNNIDTRIAKKNAMT